MCTNVYENQCLEFQLDLLRGICLTSENQCDDFKCILRTYGKKI